MSEIKIRQRNKARVRQADKVEEAAGKAEAGKAEEGKQAKSEIEKKLCAGHEIKKFKRHSYSSGLLSHARSRCYKAVNELPNITLDLEGFHIGNELHIIWFTKQPPLPKLFIVIIQRREQVSLVRL